MMPAVFNPHPYQKRAMAQIYRQEESGVFMDMGLGKTSSTLTVLNKWLRHFEAHKILIIAPLMVAENVWTNEIAKWQHLNHLTAIKVLGGERKRKKALQQPADIYVISVGNVAWLWEHYGAAWPFDTVVIDESSCFKNNQSIRFKAMRLARPFIKRIILLTGTPSANGLIDLWAQLYLLDKGERLGKHITHFRKKYFQAAAMKGHIVTRYDPLQGAKEEIYKKIGDICFSMQAKDYLQLPPVIQNTVNIPMPGQLKEKYREFERNEVLKLVNLLDEETQITAANAAVLANKLLQFANGAVYDDQRVAHEVHILKLKALEEIIDTTTGPVLVGYEFQHDRDRIMRFFGKRGVVSIKEPGAPDRWNRGEIPILLAHARSAGHGLNLQDGGNTLVHFGHSYSLELRLQINARLFRPAAGAKKPLIIHNLVLVGSMDEDVLRALDRKNAGQQELLEAVKARIKKYI